MKIKKKLIGIVVLSIFSSFSALANQNNSTSAQVVANNQGKTSIEMNYSGNYPHRLYLEKNKLTIERIPNIEEYRNFMLILENKNGEEVMKEVAENVAGKNAIFYLRNLSDAKLNVKLYCSSQRYGSYNGVLWGDDIEIEWSNNRGYFISYPYYSHNKSVLSNKRTEEKAQEYYTRPSKDIQSDAQEIKDLSNSITVGIEDNYQKAKAIYTWVCNHIYYDYDAYYSGNLAGDFSALGTLHSKRSVCEGYSNLLAALLRAAGIPTKKIVGFARGISSTTWPENLDITKDTNHAWNEAYLNGRWILMDATWDSGNEWKNGGIYKDSGIRGYHYFDISEELFSADHIIQDYSENYIPQP